MRRQTTSLEDLKKKEKANSPQKEMQRNRCSFCGQYPKPSHYMVAGASEDDDGMPNLFICEECVDVCVRLFIEAGVNKWIVRPVQEEDKPQKGKTK